MEPETKQSIGHEESDADTGAVAWTAVVLAVVVVVVSVLSWWLLEYWRTQSDRSQLSLSPLAVEQPDIRGPLLQAAPRAELEKYRQQAQSRLSSYGWIEKPRVVHIPIERAIDLVVERGFLQAHKQADEPTTPQDAADKRSDDGQDDKQSDSTHTDSDE